MNPAPPAHTPSYSLRRAILASAFGWPDDEMERALDALQELEQSHASLLAALEAQEEAERVGRELMDKINGPRSDRKGSPEQEAFCAEVERLKRVEIEKLAHARALRTAALAKL